MNPHKHRKSSQDSGRAAFADRSKLSDTTVLMLDRPPIMPEFSDVELRAKIREAITEKKAEHVEKRAGKPVLGMKAALKIRRRTGPKDGEELFGRQPNFSTETLPQRVTMKRLRKSFPSRYAYALARWNAGERDVRLPRWHRSDAPA
ncbi:MAG: hypothetical protein ACRBN8_19630, partial [Nannocystales bacterium]